MRSSPDQGGFERRAKKSLGQHFLHDGNVCVRIVDLARIGPEDQVMEIGPGPGALTDVLRHRAKSSLLLLEKDDHYAARHRDLALFGERVWHGDAMLFPWTSLEGAWIIMGNLPYNVASPLMWDIVSRVPQWKRAVFMIQKEVADRILAAPGGRTYGALSAWMRNYARAVRGFNLGPGAFSPPPKVDSTVIVLTPLPPETRPDDPDKLAKVIKICFSQRRKQLHVILRRAFGSHYDPSMLEILGIDPKARPETLMPEQFKDITRQFSSVMAGSGDPD